MVGGGKGPSLPQAWLCAALCSAQHLWVPAFQQCWVTKPTAPCPTPHVPCVLASPQHQNHSGGLSLGLFLRGCPPAVGNASPGEEEHFGTGLPPNAGLHLACGCGWDELGLQLLMAAGLCPCPGAGLGWRIPLNYFQMGINAANRVCCRIDKQTKAPRDAINKPSACCFCPGFGNILALAWGAAVPCLAASPVPWPWGRVTGIPLGPWPAGS